MESAPEEQDERVDMGMEDQESSDSSEQNIESVVSKPQQDFDEKFRNFQSLKDRETAELKVQLKQAIDLLNNRGEQSQEQDITNEYFDEDGYAKEINAKDVVKRKMQLRRIGCNSNSNMNSRISSKLNNNKSSKLL
jgi:hypothetical protein